MSYIQPSRSDVHVDRPLSNISLMYLQEAAGFVADRAFPVNPVAQKSNLFYIYDKGDFNRDEMKERAPATESAGGNYKLSTDSYNCQVFAVHRDIDDQVRANADDPLNLDREAAEWLAMKALLRKEVKWSADFFTTSIWDVDLTGVAAAPTANEFLQWNDASSTPIVDVRLGQRRIHERTARRPNKMILGREVYDTLLDHPDIVARLDRGQTPKGPALVMREALAAILELDEILVMDGIQNTAAEGATTAMSYIGGKAALLLHTPRVPGLMTPSAGYTFTWNGLLGASALSSRVSRMRVPLKKSDRFELEMAFDQKQTGSDLGQFFTAAIA